VLVALCVVATGCIKPVRAGARCKTAEWGQDNANFVLKCERGRWVRKATVAQVAQLYVAILSARTSTTPVPPTVKTGSTPPTTQYIPPSPAAGVAVGYGTACAWLANARIKCWGDNSQGALAIGNTAAYLIPIQPIFGPRGTDIAVGTGHVCAIQADRSVVCWGKNNQAQLGNTVQGLPQPVPSNAGGLYNVASLAAGDGFTCASLTTGYLQCWGNNVERQLGTASLLDTVVLQTTISGIGPTSAVSARKTVAGLRSQCVLMAPPAQVVFCVGDNDRGQLGRGGAPYNNASALAQLGGITTATDIAAGKEHYCVKLANATITCWGSNEFGQLGLQLTTTYSSVATAAGLGGFTNVAEVSANEVSTCARKTDGTVWCIGSGAEGAIGNGSWGSTTVPVQVSGINDAVDLSSGGRTSCVVRASGEVWCWGQGNLGQLGNNSTTNSNIPVKVIGFPF